MKWSETRRRKALRWTAAFAALLALYVLLLQKDPAAARTAQEEHHGTGYTQAVAMPALLEEREPFLRWCLSANEEAMLLSRVEFKLFSGWEATGGKSLDCSGEGPLWCEEGRISPPGGGYCPLCFFGRVDDPDIVRVVISCNMPGWTDVETRREDWYTWNGHSYFAVLSDYATNLDDGYQVTAYDAQGRAVEVISGAEYVLNGFENGRL